MIPTWVTVTTIPLLAVDVTTVVKTDGVLVITCPVLSMIVTTKVLWKVVL